jgi:2,3-bisphosphoglycerate-independent phosphoglycerate mutase
MKYVVLVPDGLADDPIAELGGKTPLEAASTPYLDRLASGGVIGTVRTIPDGLQPGSEVGNLSLIGYDPREFARGRAAWEAAGMGIDLGEGETALRCNLITLRDPEKGFDFDSLGPDLLMDDYAGGGIGGKEAETLIRWLNGSIGSPSIEFHAGVGYRHLLVLKEIRRGAEREEIGPHRIVGRPIGPKLPDDGVLRPLMNEAARVLSRHPVNLRRRAVGLSPANGVWFWGEGRIGRSLPSFQSRFGRSAAVISAVDVVRGIGCGVAMEPIFVRGATGRLDSDLRAKAEAALRALEKKELVYIHVEATDEASHRRSLRDKIAAIERIDRDLVGRLASALEGEDLRILVSTDHRTKVSSGEHGPEPVPFLWASGENTVRTDRRFTERAAAASGLYVGLGHRLMPLFLGM